MTDYHSILPLLALGVGIWGADTFSPVAAYGSWFIGIIFFLSALKIDPQKIAVQLEDKKLIFLELLLMLFVYPALVYFLAQIFVPELAIPLLLLAAMPAGMTSPFLSELIGGRQSLALIITVGTSLLSPFSIPLVIHFFVGQEVEISYLNMFLSLLQVIFLPFLLAQACKKFFPEIVQKTEKLYRSISTLLLNLLIAGIVAKQSSLILQGFRGGDAAFTLLVLFLFFIGFHIVGYLAPFWRSTRDRITSAVCLSYMNFTLAIYLADSFFPAASVAVPIALAVVPWVVLFIPLQIFASKYREKRSI